MAGLLSDNINKVFVQNDMENNIFGMDNWVYGIVVCIIGF